MRTKGSNGERLDKQDEEISNLKREAEKSKEKFEQHITVHIKEDLMTPKFKGSEKYLYTYDEIAEKYDIPKSRVQKVAEENDLTRRKLKIVK
jgi:hypothetical protein